MKAVILSAGTGSRMGGLTRHTPKPMLLLQDRPILEYSIRHLASQGIREIALNLFHHPDVIRDYFGDGSRWGVLIHYLEEKTLSGTAGALKRLAPWLAGGGDFAVLYGDILTDQELSGPALFHRQRQALATLVLHKRAASNSVIAMDASRRITLFLERPTDQELAGLDESLRQNHWVNSGIQILSERALSLIPEQAPADLPKDLYCRYYAEHPIYGYPLTGQRIAIDTPQRYEEAKKAVKDGLFKPL